CQLIAIAVTGGVITSRESSLVEVGVCTRSRIQRYGGRKYGCLTPGVKAAPEKLCRNHAGSLVELELQNHPGFDLGFPPVSTLTLAISQLVAESVDDGAGGTRRNICSRAGNSICREVALGRHHNRKLGREPPITRAAQLLHETEAELWRALVQVTPVGSIKRGLKQVH